MQFNSLQFLLFFPVVAGCYFAIPFRYRWALLLAASYYFYMCWKAEYIILILASTAIDYLAAIGMEKCAGTRTRRMWLVLSLCANLGILFAFKYFNFFSDSVRAALDRFDLFYDVPQFEALLPVGISFYTFQSMSYTIDVYRRARPAERHVGLFALYVAFFPQLVAGPIERSTRLLPQFRKQFDFDYRRVVSGLQLIFWGLFKKMVIADRLAHAVDQVYGNPDSYAGPALILASYFFAFQIYCDFSAYSDIAVGSARVLGYDLMQNFRRPYLATSISNFWQRWHISLSTWFRDYLYIPLGGNRAGKIRWQANLLAVFLVSGLWHGANWTFIAWGGLHGAYMVIGIWTASLRNRAARLAGLTRHPRIRAGFQIVITFHLAVAAWVFFRANTVAEAVNIIRSTLDVRASLVSLQHVYQSGAFEETFGLDSLHLAFSGGLVMFLVSIQCVQERCDIRALFNRAPLWLRWAIYVSGALAILNLGVIAEVPFIYFQF